MNNKNDYIGYYKDIPKPEQLVQRRMKMTDNTSVFKLVADSEKLTENNTASIKIY